ncbi:phage neck terminator protein [Phocoenobacter skyensis]|uniref:Phage neck terminator protein gp12-like domain-containing protein n=1 Tax=Phocoenobacter skyensis TaxID=97481 RepID=A0ABT9JIF4_9PAST|nr:hypothetical protein [Pasteurella skyensis]MDP8078337.1 hypothetical protein [Pasteurella skyensis]MDP8084571.1 hypothetical protein [Pasteurella skyensis]
MRKKLHQVIQSVTDGQVFFAYQNGVKLPPKPYFTLFVISEDISLPVHREIILDNGERVIEAHRQAMVQVDCYGKSSVSLLNALALRLTTDKALTLCDELNVAISCDSVKAAPVSVSKVKWEDRAILTLYFNYTTQVEETVPIIEKTILSGDYLNG